MSQLLVWITRPHSHEILMGGDRNLTLWTARPYYSHAAKLHDFKTRDGGDRYVDLGWEGKRQGRGIRAKPLLKQNAALRSAVWQEVFLSVCPKGMTLDEGQAWSETQRGNEWFDGSAITLWHNLKDDDAWEAKCNISHKRFLLEVDLLSLTVKRVAPLVLLRRSSTDDQIPDSLHTDAIDPALAVEYWHSGVDPDRIPF